MKSLVLLALLLTACPAWAEDLTARVVAHHDGDTFTVELEAKCLPNLFRRLAVRVRGCDTPEMRDQRQEMRALAREARAKAAELVPVGSQVVLRDVAWDKYGGRILADVEGFCAFLIDAGMAKTYNGHGGKPW